MLVAQVMGWVSPAGPGRMSSFLPGAGGRGWGGRVSRLETGLLKLVQYYLIRIQE